MDETFANLRCILFTYEDEVQKVRHGKLADMVAELDKKSCILVNTRGHPINYLTSKDIDIEIPLSGFELQIEIENEVCVVGGVRFVSRDCHADYIPKIKRVYWIVSSVVESVIKRNDFVTPRTEETNGILKCNGFALPKKLKQGEQK